METEMENKHESEKSQTIKKRKNIERLESGVNHATNKTLISLNSDTTLVPPLV